MKRKSLKEIKTLQKKKYLNLREFTELEKFYTDFFFSSILKR